MESAAVNKTLILFAHAAGFCKNVWNPVIETLSRVLPSSYECKAIDLLGHGAAAAGPTKFDTMDVFVGPVKESLKKYSEYSSIIGVGHSLGASVLSRIQLQDPNSFSQLILVEPIIFEATILKAMRGPSFQNPLSVSTLRRRATFRNWEEVEQYFHSKKLFQSFDSRSLSCYLAGGLKQSEDGSDQWSLRCDPKFESQIYIARTPSIEEFTTLSSFPLHLLVGECSTNLDAFGGTLEYYRRIVGGSPAATLCVLPNLAHFAPMEDPRLVASVIGALVGTSVLRCKL